MDPQFRALVEHCVAKWLDANRRPVDEICHRLGAHLGPLIAGEIERASLKAIGQLGPEERDETARLVGRAAAFVRRHLVQRVSGEEAEALCLELGALETRLSESLIAG